MFTPEIAKKCTFVLNAEVEKELKLLLDDLIAQEIRKLKANAPDLELRMVAVKTELLTNLKNYRQLLQTAVANHGERKL